MSDEELLRYLKRDERRDRFAMLFVICVLCPLVLWALYAHAQWPN